MLTKALRKRLVKAFGEDEQFEGWLDAVLEIHELRRKPFDIIGVNELARITNISQPTISNALNPHLKMNLCQNIRDILRGHIDGK